MEELLDLLDEYHVKATFFWLGECALAHRELVAEVSRRGHEIASHGLRHVKINSLQRAEFREATANAKNDLEAITGKGVRGFRAPYFSIDHQSFWALDVLRELGFSYDSSIFPIHYWHYGMPGFNRGVTKVQTESGELLEYAINPAKLGPIKLPFSGGAYMRILPYWLIRKALQSLESECMSAVFYLHPWELDVNHPRVMIPSTVQLSHYANLRTTRPKLQRLFSEFQFTSFEHLSAELPVIGQAKSQLAII